MNMLCKYAMYLKLHSNKMHFVYVMPCNRYTVVKLSEANEGELDIYVVKCQRRSLQDESNLPFNNQHICSGRDDQLEPNEGQLSLYVYLIICLQSSKLKKLYAIIIFVYKKTVLRERDWWIIYINHPMPHMLYVSANSVSSKTDISVLSQGYEIDQKSRKGEFLVWLKLLVILAIFPVTTSASERSFSTLCILKSYLRNTVGENRLNGLALMNIHRYIYTEEGMWGVEPPTYHSYKMLKHPSKMNPGYATKSNVSKRFTLCIESKIYHSERYMMLYRNSSIFENIAHLRRKCSLFGMDYK
ncbi:hypothetical protein AGLY_012615 [Aphis glycines]|uniref:HAT C-terminal dimerisation domain-containing protein n=1 Tax=Aphis glycines TaxID=307491 RepID=A0A6G0T963_APHGL|nr:hypothetical protein AGLY_012615 [Aphis glycines]